MTPSPSPSGVPPAPRGSAGHFRPFASPPSIASAAAAIAANSLASTSTSKQVQSVTFIVLIGNFGAVIMGREGEAERGAEFCTRRVTSEWEKGGKDERISRANEGGREKEWRERSSVSISLRTLEFASNICPPTNATDRDGRERQRARAHAGGRGGGVGVGVETLRLDGIVGVVGVEE